MQKFQGHGLSIVKQADVRGLHTEFGYYNNINLIFTWYVEEHLAFL
jgi:hypothetical protein